jgi:Type VI secretion system (T6SS), amidase effector protein 4
MIFENTTDVLTNNIVNSTIKVKLKKIVFEDLWDKYPSGIKHINAKTGKDEFSDHCAINVSESLYQNEITLKSFKGAKCYSKCPSGDNVHALRAEELANWINKKPFAGCPETISGLTGTNFEEKVKDKTGIIFFKDYWHRKGETGETRSGDHIDLWNKNKLASIGLFLTWTRRTFPDLSENWLDMSDLRKSKKVLFWEIQ